MLDLSDELGLDVPVPIVVVELWSITFSKLANHVGCLLADIPSDVFYGVISAGLYPH